MIETTSHKKMQNKNIARTWKCKMSFDVEKHSEEGKEINGKNALNVRKETKMLFIERKLQLKWNTGK